MKKLILLIFVILVISVGWWAVGDFMDKTENIRERASENAKVQGNQGEKFTSKMLGWLGIAHGGDPNKPETWDVINGIKVPPMPDEKENNKTIGGIDVNDNGVRDDVERAIAREFGNDGDLYSKVINYSKLERNMLINPNEKEGKTYSRAVSCIQPIDYRQHETAWDVQLIKTKQLFERVDKITDLQLNTRIRRVAYANGSIKAGVTGGCAIKKDGSIQGE